VIGKIENDVRLVQEIFKITDRGCRK